MVSQKFSLLVALILLFVSCKKKEIKTDNLFKFRDYISYTTSGMVSAASPIQINLANDVKGWDAGQEISDKLIIISPYAEGKLTVVNNHALVFTPDEHLEPNTEYSVTLKLNSIYKNIPKGYENYTFQFKTIPPNFNIVTKSLQSYSKDWQYIEGVIKSADIISLDKAKQLIKASQNNKKLNIVFNELMKPPNSLNLK